MSHKQQMGFVGKVKSKFPEKFNKSKVLEIGSLNINGTVRIFFNSCDYLGIDVGPGRGVDRVCQGQDFDGEDNSYDTVVSCKCFKHNPFWVETFKNMHRVCKTGGG